MILEKEIENLYDKFFANCKIDSQSGLVEGTTKRFATMPYIGRKYENAKKKILIVGLDMGKDEYHAENTYQKIDDRRANIACDAGFNPHIAGTYATALSFLKDLYHWEDLWAEIDTFSTSQQATKVQKHKNGENPLDYISLVNFYKFVEVERLKRAGDLDRKFVSKDFETDLFISEVKILDPDVIIFQGKPKNQILERVKTLNKEIFVAPHPSYREKDGRKASTYLDKFEKK